MLATQNPTLFEVSIQRDSLDVPVWTADNGMVITIRRNGSAQDPQRSQVAYPDGTPAPYYASSMATYGLTGVATLRRLPD